MAGWTAGWGAASTQARAAPALLLLLAGAGAGLASLLLPPAAQLGAAAGLGGAVAALLRVWVHRTARAQAPHCNIIALLLFPSLSAHTLVGFRVCISL